MIPYMAPSDRQAAMEAVQEAFNKCAEAGISVQALAMAIPVMMQDAYADYLSG